jgi:hypothetical protein
VPAGESQGLAGGSPYLVWTLWMKVTLDSLPPSVPPGVALSSSQGVASVYGAPAFCKRVPTDRAAVGGLPRRSLKVVDNLPLVG